MLLTYKREKEKNKRSNTQVSGVSACFAEKKKKKSDCEYEGSLVSDFKGLLVDCSFPFGGAFSFFFFFSYYYLLVLKKNVPFFSPSVFLCCL